MTSWSTRPVRRCASTRPRDSAPTAATACRCACPSMRPRRLRRWLRRSSGCAGASAARFLVGVGHGTCTCEGAAFEYIVNLEFELRNRGVRDQAEITWITNEYELGDFGMGGMHLKRGGYVTPSSIFNASLFAERGIDWITRAHVQKVEPGRVLYETLDGNEARAGLRLRDAAAPVLGRRPEGLRPRPARTSPSSCSCRTSSCASTPTTHPKPYEDWRASDWPRTYQSPGVPERLRRRHRLRAASPDLRPAQEPQRHRDRPGAAPHRHALGNDRQGGRRAASST